ncbi:MAG: UbiA prenyltransferase family protein [Anaerolineaceae bacterium]|nr:UbiA prenyltransferase family protein [Anaerolineaceae bacterium]
MGTVKSFWRGMRPTQWSKNLLIFAGLVFDGKLLQGALLLEVVVGFGLLCMITSSIYLLNDLVDLESDRKHPTKQLRPLASGEITAGQTRLVALLLASAAVFGSFLLNSRLTLVFVAYLVLQLLYVRWLRNFVLIDIMSITAGFVLRVLAGVVIVQVSNFSPWLYICSALLALFLAIAKRRQEFLLLAGQAADLRVTFRHYNLTLLDDMLRFVLTSTFVAYLLYTTEAETIRVANTNSALITIPFVLFGLLRYLWLIHVKEALAAPDELLARDRPLQLAILLWAISFLLILYVPGTVTP